MNVNVSSRTVSGCRMLAAPACDRLRAIVSASAAAMTAGPKVCADAAHRSPDSTAGSRVRAAGIRACSDPSAAVHHARVGASALKDERADTPALLTDPLRRPAIATTDPP